MTHQRRAITRDQGLDRVVVVKLNARHRLVTAFTILAVRGR